MKRDWDKVRELLLFVEENDSADLTKCDDITKQHGQLLLEEGYVENLSPIGGVVLGRLKWKGHDLIDSIRDDSVWKETKSRLAKVSGTASLEIVKAVAQVVIKTMLEIQ